MSNISKKLMQLIDENPELPMISIRTLDRGTYCISPITVGKVTDTWLDEYLISSDGNTAMLKSENLSQEGVLYTYLRHDDYDAIKSPEDAKRVYENLPWKKAIVLRVCNVSEETYG